MNIAACQQVNVGKEHLNWMTHQICTFMYAIITALSTHECNECAQNYKSTPNLRKIIIVR